jgi:MerR family transcriptional regulator, light-induced transcriptional regulator
MNTSNVFPIRVLSEKSQVGSSTLRAWERRYGLLKPLRTPKGHRLYSQKDIDTVKRIRALIAEGHSLLVIKDVISAEHTSAEHTSAEYFSAEQGNDKNPMHKMLENSGASSDLVAKTTTIWDHNITQILEAVHDFSIERIDIVFNEASALYPLDLVIEKLIEPILETLGILWKENVESGIAEEHFFSSWLDHKLASRFVHFYPQAKGDRIICACVPGTFHEVGLKLFSLSALSSGYRVQYYGANLPFDQLHYIMKKTSAKAVVLSINKEMHSNVNRQLADFIDSVKTPVFIGGLNNNFDQLSIQSHGGIILGNNVMVALKIVKSYLSF